MPRIAAIAVATPIGGLGDTMAALLRSRASLAGRLPHGIEETLVELANRVLDGSPAELVLLATTKGDTDRWCDSLLAGPARYHGGPAELARNLAGRLGAPVMAVSAACASSPVACGIAARSICSGRLRRVLVLAGDSLGAFIRDGFAALGAIDARGCHPFDSARAGLALGETASALLLTAPESPSGVFLHGWGASLDANHLTGPSRDGRGLEQAVSSALRRAEVPEPALIIGHGTGTRYNDDSESLAYERIARQAPVVAYKGLLGHSLGACGLSELAIASQTFAQRCVPGTVGLAQQGCAGDIRVLPPGTHPFRPGSVLCANAGFGGINGAVVIGERPARAAAGCRSVMRARLDIDQTGWRRVDADGSHRDGRWQAFGADGLPTLPASEVIGRPDPHWGRMDLACRALVALASFAPALPDGSGLVLATDTGCAATDRRFELGRRTQGADPQRFAYTLPTAPVGEASIRLGIRGPGFTLLGASDAQVRVIVQEAIGDGLPAILVARVEADHQLLAWAELWLNEEHR